MRAELKKLLTELEALVAQTKAVAECADDETIEDLGHWVSAANSTLQNGLAPDPGESGDLKNHVDPYSDDCNPDSPLLNWMP